MSRLYHRVAALLQRGLFCFCINAAVLLLLPVCIAKQSLGREILSFVVAAVFWVATLAGHCLLHRANKLIKSVRKDRAKKHSVWRSIRSCGAFRFFRCPEARWADLACAVLIILFVLQMFLPVYSNWLMAINLTLVILTLQLHGIFNGQIYHFLKKQKDGRV